MSKLDVCRACLSHDTQMSALTSTRYKEIYEKHTGAKLITGHGRPDKVCNNCNLQLQSFHKFLQMSKKTEKYLSDTYKNGVELLQEKLSELARDLQSLSDPNIDSNSTSVTCDEDVEIITAPSNATQDVAIKIESVDYDEEINLVEDIDTEEFEISVENHDHENHDLLIPKGKPSIQRTYILKDHTYSKHALDLELPHIDDNDTQKDSEEDSSTAEYNSSIGEYNLPIVTVELERISITKHQLRSAKSIKTKTPPEKELYSCHECDYKCQFKTIMEKHIRIHTLSKSRARTVNNLKKRERTGILKRGECDTCGKIFAKSLYLQRHKRLHTTKQVYTCEMCNRQFNHKSTFLVHTRTHTGEKPFACKWCVKTFNDKSNCRKHMKTHTETAIHACFMCEKTFSQWNRLKEHAVEHIL